MMMGAALAILPLNASAASPRTVVPSTPTPAAAAATFHPFAGARPDKVVASKHNDLSAPFRSIAASTGDTGAKVAPLPQRPPSLVASSSTTGLPASSSSTSGTQAPGTAAAPATGGSGAEAPVQLLSFDGAGSGIPYSTNSYVPPDPNGAVGANNYVEVVNSMILIFDKSGNLVQAPNRMTSLWQGFGGYCETVTGTDPVAMYDRIAHRWIVSFFVEGAPYDYCVAVSTSEDPTGTWNRYDFPQILFPDYQKMGVWTDGYYFTTNQFTDGAQPDGASAQGSVPITPGASPGPALGAFDRSAMLAGLPATMQVFYPGNRYWGVMPAYFDGQNLPPAGSPGYFVSAQRNSFSSRGLVEWKLHLDWSNPAASVLSPPQSIPVPAWQGSGGIPQPGTTSLLETMGDAPMYRLSYRNFGDHESLYIAQSVISDTPVNGNSGMRWYELRNPAGAVQLYQEQTYAPDSNWRWMGSVAADRQGNVALGYSLSSSTIFPSVAYTSRSVTDPLGTMLNPETVVGIGGHSGGADRWGDYTSMVVDPVDDCTFWYTGEYYGPSTDFTWRTRVAAFRFPSCLRASSIATVSSSANPGSTAGLVTLSATVSGGSGVPTGTVTFRDGATVLGTSTVSGGTATLGTTLSVGSHPIVAAYSGDSVYSGTSSATFAQAISLAPGVPSGGNTPPGAPTAVSAVGGYLQATVNWTAPASNGGSAITGYTVVANPGGFAATAAAGATSASVAGLTNGTSYTFTVLASNSLGAGPASSSSSSVTPGPPGQPTNVVVTNVGSGQATVSWVAPAQSGAGPVTQYDVMASPQGIATSVSGNVTSMTLTGMTNGVTYTVDVIADNSVDASLPSSPSAPFTPTGSPSLPDPPTNVVAIAGDSQAQISWTAPANTGGSPITSYQVHADPGIAMTIGGGTGTISTVINGLSNGSSYTFIVDAVNATGKGLFSAPSAPVTPNPYVPHTWTKMAPATSPSARSDAGMAYDPLLGKTILFGGAPSSGSPFGDTWSWDGSNWTKLSPTTSPPARSGIANGMAFDSALGKIVLFGGHSSSANLGDTWTFDGTTWAQLGGSQPTARQHHSLAYDPNIGGVDLFGGNNGSNLNDTWQLIGTSWTKLAAQTSPPAAREYASLAYDPVGQAVTLFGGYSSKYLNDQWLLSGGVWYKQAPQSAPSARRGMAVINDPVLGGLVMFGGYNGTSYLSDTYVFHYLSNIWTRETLTTSPSTRWLSGMAFGTGGTLSLFGGTKSSTPVGDTWSLNGVLTPRAPTSPGIVTATPSNSAAFVSWTSPTDNGGAPITGFKVTSSPGGFTATNNGTTDSATVHGLTNGTSYTFTVVASNSAGTSAASGPSGPVTPVNNGPTVPGAPTGVVASSGNGSVALSWSPPPSNGGATINSYTVTCSPSGTGCPASQSLTGSPANFSGLTNGTAYTFTVAAVNSVGTGPSATASATPVTVPGSPTNVVASTGNANVMLSWSAPSSNGGAAVTSYTVTCSPSGTGCPATQSTSSTSANFNGLTNGTTYTFTVAAVNSAGTGPAVTVQATPLALPGAPTSVTANPGNASAYINFNPPASDGGSTITSYTVASGGQTWSVDPNAGLPFQATGLTNGVSYTFTVTASNANGTGPASAASNSVTPLSTITVPGTPTNVAATAGNTTATVTWTAPSNGGSPIVSYSIGNSAGGGAGVDGSQTSYTFTGLTNGTTYTFTVLATNDVGDGPASAPSNPVTPVGNTVPGAPTNVVATAGNAQATVSWTPPTSNGGSAITSFTVTQTPGGVTSTTGPSATSLTVFGLTNGTAYTFTVFATNGVGNGPASAPSNTVTPVGSATISNLVVGDTANAANWSIQQNIQVGNLEYEDRTYTIKTLPSALAGSQWIRPANASKTSTANPLVTFTISAPMTVYVAVDTRLGRRPWMDSTWTDSNTQITDSESTPVTFEIFQKSITTAGQVSLGPNVGSGSTYVQYLVIAR
jgi:titin